MSCFTVCIMRVVLRQFDVVIELTRGISESHIMKEQRHLIQRIRNAEKDTTSKI
jgi:hypothetical protein